ncbi:FMN-binding negative transcriptional regulator [Sphingobacterium haloxyli]|nr:FMN-binding negative transcriptional regulator [Sphingobacterium haloxyli]
MTMYVPALFRFTDFEEQLNFMQKYSFATVLNYNGERIVGSHLPLVATNEGDEMVLLGHLAKSNEQAGLQNGADCLVVFSGPHAYISPRYYDKAESVPTWDYIAVHAYGTFTIEVDKKMAIMEQTICYFEEEYMVQWESLPTAYKEKMMDHIVVFSIRVHRIEGQKKLSQNKKPEEIERMKRNFADGADPYAQDLAQYLMTRGSENFYR